ADSIAIDLADDRFVAFQHAIDDALGFADAAIELGRVVMQPLHVLDVATGAESTASTSEDDDVALLVLNQIVEQPGQLGVRLASKAIQLLRLVEGNGENAATAFEGHRLVVSEIHRRSP